MCRILLILALLISENLNAYSINKPISIDSRIKTFVYSPNEVFTVVFSQGYYSYIEFAEGEKVKNIAVGDASSWKINPYDNKLLVMPFEVSSRTNMIIMTTKKRNYIFDLISRPNYDKYPDADTKRVNQDFSAEKDISYVIRFYYPQEEDEFDIDLDEISLPTQMEYFTEKPGKIIQENDTRYNYTYIDDGDNVDIVPIELFDDGYLTYLKFRNSNKIPQIFVKENDKPCTRLLYDGYVVIKGVYKYLFIRYEGSEVKVINRSL